jgi:mannose-6-phosphate isomerase
VSPLRLTPSFREKVWGATKLEPWFPNSTRKIGEVWFEGIANPPLLIKFLFTSENLSVQVHPDDAFASRHHNSCGKTEMWHILAAEPGAKIAAGFREPLSAERLEEAALSGEIETLLEWFDAAPGDTFFIPAGTVHAIGAGLALCEIQQYSDVTYRLYDYGRPRELHLEKALAVSHLGRSNARQKPSGERLVSCEYFITKRLEIDQPRRHQPRSSEAEFLIVIEGQGAVGGEPSQAGDCWYFPAGGPIVDLSGRMILLQTGTISTNTPQSGG